MTALGERIKELLKQKSMTQIELANKVSISKVQMVRYLNHDVQPGANTLKKIADVLNTNVDFLLSGNKDEKAQAALKNMDLLNHFKAVELMNDKDKMIVTELINAFVTRRQLQKMI